jgi:hypothetical protein
MFDARLRQTLTLVLLAAPLLGARGGCTADVTIGIGDAGTNQLPDTAGPETQVPATCTGATCGAGTYCQYPATSKCGSSGSGTCSTVPTSCASTSDPVCGCDGKTYANPCEAAKASVSVATKGACAAPECGGSTGKLCKDDEYCRYEGAAKCGSGTGTCAKKPVTCTPGSEAVCGCDGKTYENECFANALGVSVAWPGACVPPDCGGTTGKTCPATEWCRFPISAACGSGTGACAPKTTTTCDPGSPVCGCDGKTYASACEADNAYVSVSKLGACTKTCGGLTGGACSPAEYCAYGLADNCGIGDISAICEPRPATCSKIIDFVCGCDGKTYDNECDANRAGVAIRSKGICET